MTVPLRIAPVMDADMSVAQRDALAPFVRDDGCIHNVFRTMGRYPAALRRWTPFINHVLFKSSLALREKELLILRTAALCGSDYAWAQHLRVARRAGLSDRQILAVRDGPESPIWSSLDAALLQAADDLHYDTRISDETWSRLSPSLSLEQLMDVVLTVGQYNLAAMILNTCGVQIDPDLLADPPLALDRVNEVAEPNASVVNVTP